MPRNSAERTRLLSLLAPALVLLASVSAIQLSAWKWLRVGPKAPGFADLRLVTATADCIRENPDWSMSSATCDPFGRPNNYPSIWGRTFAWLRLGNDDVVMVGYVILVAFCIACGVLLFQLGRTKSSSVTWTVTSLSVLSPPVWLAIERGNVDLIVFTVLVGAMFAAFAGRSGLSAAILGLCTSMKLFPIGGAISLRRRRDFAILLLSFVVTGGFLLISELGYISDRTQYSGYSSFGVGVLPVRIADMFGTELTFPAARAAGLGVLGASILLGLVALRRNPPVQAMSELSRAVREEPRGRTMLTVGWGSFLIAYMAGTSWDYRLIMLIPCIVAFAMHDRPRSLARLAMITLSVTMFLTYPVGRLDIVGDLLLLVLTPALTIFVMDVVFAGRLTVNRSGRLDTPADSSGGHASPAM